MAFIEWFELGFIAVFLVGCVTQVFYPLLRGTPMFPLFRKEALLLGVLAEEKQRQVEKAIEKSIEKLKEENEK